MEFAMLASRLEFARHPTKVGLGILVISTPRGRNIRGLSEAPEILL
jgi:hypothetical protein